MKAENRRKPTDMSTGRDQHIVGDTVYEGQVPLFAEFQADHAGRPVMREQHGVMAPVPVGPGDFGRTIWLKTRKGTPWVRVGYVQ